MNIPIHSYNADGSLLDLTDVQPSDIDFLEMAETLSKLPRFFGRNRGAPIFVAQHCVVGAQAILRETGNKSAAALFLLHDGHEYLIGDVITPTLKLLAHHFAIGQEWHQGEGCSSFNAASHRAKVALDQPIYLAARLMPLHECPEPIRNDVVSMDNTMLINEAYMLFGDAPYEGHDRRICTELQSRWPSQHAESLFLALFNDLIGDPANPRGLAA